MKIDLHVHTSELSLCGKLTIEETISLYRKTDYDAIVVADHFTADTGEVYLSRGIRDYAEYYFERRQLAVELGRKHGFLVLPGCELRFKENINDYLVYGLTPEHVRMRPDIFDMKPADFSEFASPKSSSTSSINSRRFSEVTKHGGFSRSFIDNAANFANSIKSSLLKTFSYLQPI